MITTTKTELAEAIDAIADDTRRHALNGEQHDQLRTAAVVLRGAQTDAEWINHPQTIEAKAQWDAVAHALGANADCPDTVLAAARKLGAQPDADRAGDAPIDVTDPWRGLYLPEHLRADEDGGMPHPDLPSWPDDREEGLDKLVHAQGFDFQMVDGEFSDEAVEDGGDLYWQEMRAWAPEVPAGEWRLAWKGDTEDGPCAWFVRPMALRPEPEAPATSQTDAGSGGDALPSLPIAFFDEFGRGADDRVQDYVRAALAARQPSYVQGSDELRARTDGERAAYMEGLEEGRKIAARQPVGVGPKAQAVVPYQRAHALLSDAYMAGTQGTGFGDQAEALFDEMMQTPPAPAAVPVDGLRESQILAKDHDGMRVSYSGLLRQTRGALTRGSADPALAEMLRQLEKHMEELGKRWYAGDRLVVDELLQLYCIETNARRALLATQPQPAAAKGGDA